MTFGEVINIGRSGFLYTAIGITFVITLGLLLGRVLTVEKKQSLLITVCTAICGGSAIAAVASVTEVNEEQIAAALGTVFVLNSVALFLFPPIG